MPRKITSLSPQADEDMTQVVPHWDAAVSSSQLVTVGSSPQSQAAARGVAALRHRGCLPVGDTQRHRGGWRCLSPAASILPLAPAQLQATGLPPRADFLQALGRLAVSGDQQKSSTLALCFGA